MASKTIDIKINDAALRRLAAAAPATAVGTLQSVLATNAAEILRVAKAIVPLDTGDLMSTGHWKFSPIPPPAVSVIIAFGGPKAPYAVVQHENLTFRHKPGRMAKYLERPTMARAGKLASDIANELAIRMRRSQGGV